MFQTAAGITIPFPEKLHEQYQREGDSLICNLSFEKLADFIYPLTTLCCRNPYS